MQNLLMDRRRFLARALGATAAGTFVPSLALGRAAWATLLPPAAPAGSPILGLSGAFASSDFGGDELDRPHDLLWNKDQYLRERGGLPRPSEQAEVVVVGGGIAGLLAAYQLRDLNPILLEGASRFGGNSRGESWGGETFSSGAAYVSRPDAGSDTAALLSELGLLDGARLEAGEEAVQFGPGILHGFWQGATDPARAGEFARVHKEFGRIRDEAYPDIPHLGSESAIPVERLRGLDAMTFKQWLDTELGGVHPHVEEFFQLYCFSSFAAGYDEVSAAQAQNFLAADLGGTIALPGGNAAIAAELHRRLSGARLRAGAVVIDVCPNAEGVLISYEDAQRNFRSIQARACVVTAPKFVSQFVVSGLGAEQIAAMRRIRSRAYIVANVMLRGRRPSPCYELFRLEGSAPVTPGWQNRQRPWTDAVFGSWAGGDAGERSVLTFYRALPYDGARPFLFNPGAHDRHKGQIERELPSLLAALGVGEDEVEGIRMTRWGHAIPVAAPGLIASGVLETAAAPVDGRIFFANQDNWCNPCFETSTAAARVAAAGVRSRVGSR